MDEEHQIDVVRNDLHACLASWISRDIDSGICLEVAMGFALAGMRTAGLNKDQIMSIIEESLDGADNERYIRYD